MVSAMRRRRSGLLLILALVPLVLLAAPGASWAHSGTEWLSDEIVTPRVDVPPTSDSPFSFTLRAAPPSPGLSWPVLLGAFIIAAIGWQRPRRALALAVVLLLALFAFEDGIHSVHHMLDRSQAKCAVAVAAAHLSADTAGDGPVTAVILLAPAVATEIGQPDPVALFPSPAQGRAPPIVAA
jgi:hypothetical protein